MASVFVWAACGDDDGAGAASVVDAGSDVALDTAPRDATGPNDPTDAPFVHDSGIRPIGDRDAGPEDAIVFDVGGTSIPCVANGQLEVEPNDTKATANTLTGSRCGIVRIVAAPPPDTADAGTDDAGDAGPDDAGDTADADAVDASDADAGAPDADADAGVVSESDFLTFRISSTATRFEIQYHGAVQLFVSVGDAAPLNLATTPTLPFRRDQPYFIEVRSADGEPHPWRVTLFED
ncbi:MAG: hypothetical protein KIT84_25890 [Labilithrix sp.]|nr:hypothetical protein [Labilithrix sp.]MCW5814486.1 hypothetical protein [Labilithrix sp.]